MNASPLMFFRASDAGVAPRPQLLEERIDGTSDVFLVPFLDGYLYYSPLNNTTILLDGFAASAVRKQFAGDALAPAEQAVIDRLGPAVLRVPLPDEGVGPHDNIAWVPTSATFSATQKCTLRCKYCYAEGGRLDDLDLPWPIARAAIDLVIANAVKEQVNPSITFLGEGEATASWDVFCRTIDYFEEQCAAHGLKPAVSLSTNGVFSRQRLDYVAAHCTHLTISIDGIQRVHDGNRVLPNGKGSFDRIMATLRGLEARGVGYDIRSTVTAASCSTMADFVTFVGENLQCRSIHFEPVFDVTSVTSSLADRIDPLDPAEFVANYRKARRAAAGLGIEIYYSGASMRSKDSFCGATDASTFLVTTRGLVTSCNEVLQPSDPRAQIFHYGAWNEEAGAFVIDPAAVNRLGKLNVREMPKCQGCMAKYNCAGDCYAKSALVSGTGDPAAAGYTGRCQITRELLKDNLMMALISTQVGVEPPPAEQRACAM
jgi:uncharacterized protein